MSFWDQISGEAGRYSATAAKQKQEQILAYLMDHQKNFILDPARRKSLRTGRRSGKTVTAASYILHTAEDIPDARMLYVTGTLDQAAKLIIESPRSGIRSLAPEFGIKCKIRTKPADVSWTNGAHLQLSGANKQEAVEALRGDALDLVIIDEAGTSIPDKLLSLLIHEILGPRLYDRKGTIVLMGTPGYTLHGEFYRATPNEPKPGGVVKPYGAEGDWGDTQWSFHTWGVRDNYKEPQIWEETKADKARKQWADTDPRWVREGLGLWAVDKDKRMIRADLTRAVYPAGQPLPELPPKAYWQYVLGIDFGYQHDSAFVVYAYSDNYPVAYHVHSYSAPGMNTDDIESYVKYLIGQYGMFSGMVADSNGKITIETLNARNGWNIQSAHKGDKMDAVELLTADLETGHLKLMADSELVRQMQSWVRDKNHGMREAKNQKDHEIDAALYAHKFLNNKLWSPTEAPPPNDYEEIIALAEEKAQREAANRHQRSGDQWDGYAGRRPKLDDWY